MTLSPALVAALVFIAGVFMFRRSRWRGVVFMLVAVLLFVTFTSLVDRTWAVRALGVVLMILLLGSFVEVARARRSRSRRPT